jgi:hypothetical protein
MANFGKEGKPEPVIAKISQETLAAMIGTTRPRVNAFMNKFRKLDRCGTDHSTPLLVSRLPVYRRGFRHSERLLPERSRKGRGGVIGLHEPRRER